MGDAADHALIRMRLLLGNRLFDVGDDVLHGLAHGLAVMRVQQVNGPWHEGVPHVLRQAHDVEEHGDRQGPAEGRRELASALVRDLVEWTVRTSFSHSCYVSGRGVSMRSIYP
jgi:hypothetical protein